MRAFSRVATRMYRMPFVCNGPLRAFSSYEDISPSDGFKGIIGPAKYPTMIALEKKYLNENITIVVNWEGFDSEVDDNRDYDPESEEEYDVDQQFSELNFHVIVEKDSKALVFDCRYVHDGLLVEKVTVGKPVENIWEVSDRVGYSPYVPELEDTKPAKLMYTYLGDRGINDAWYENTITWCEDISEKLYNKWNKDVINFMK